MSLFSANKPTRWRPDDETELLVVFYQTVRATRHEWEAIYKAVPSNDESGICGDINATMNGRDFDEQVDLLVLIGDQLDAVIVAAYKSGAKIELTDVVRSQSSIYPRMSFGPGAIQAEGVLQSENATGTLYQCQCCGHHFYKDAIIYGPDPYEQDVNDDHTPVYLCGNCHENKRQDI